jgi:hypothetical protein
VSHQRRDVPQDEKFAGASVEDGLGATRESQQLMIIVLGV